MVQVTTELKVVLMLEVRCWVVQNIMLKYFRCLGHKTVLICSLSLTDQMSYSLTLAIVHTDAAFPRNQFFNEICVNRLKVL